MASGAGMAVPRTSHAAADLGAQALAGWMPPLLSADAEWLNERTMTISRIRDMTRNDGWSQAAVDRQVDMAIGATFRLNARPNARALGISDDEADELGEQIEAKWHPYANDPTFRCDAQRQLNFVGGMGLMCREVVMGEALAVLRWKPRPGFQYATAFHIIDADRLDNPNGQPDNDQFRGGVELDADGAPVAYHIRRGHPGDFSSDGRAWQWDRFPRFDQVGSWDRWKVLHVFEKRRADQHRGISRLAAALVKSRLLARHAENEVKAGAINGTVIGAIYTQMGAEFAAEALGNDTTRADWKGFNDNRAEFYGDRKVLEDARFVTLFPSDRLDLNTTPRQTSGFPAFQTAFLQGFAASLGISYEQLSMDWSRTNYSSARAALNEVWRTIQRLRALMIWNAAQPIYTAWLEEAIDIGEIVLPAGAPDFYDAPAAYVQADWTGPGRGYVDPVKEATAAELRIENLLSTYERECSDQGQDFGSVVAARRREDKIMQRAGFTRPAPRPVVTVTEQPEPQPGAAPAGN